MYCQSCGAYNPGNNVTCLNCHQPLPGRGAPASAKCRTHPEVAAAGTCSRCGTFYCGNCLRPVGAQWLCESCLALASTLPWDERERVGLWRAWWRTAVQLISRPIQTLSTAHADASLGSSVLFSVLATVFGMGPTMFLYAIVFAVAGLALPGSDFKLGMSAAVVPVVLVFYAVLLVAMQIAAVFFTAALDHVGLLLLGARPKSYSVSVRANALALSPYLLGLVPLCSLYVFPVWALVLRVFAVMHFHQVSAGKATAAVLVPTVLLCGLCFGGYFALIMLAAGIRG